MSRTAHYGCLLMAALASGPSAAHADEMGSAPLTRIEVLLTVAPTVGAVVRAAMLEEAAAIWRQHDVVIDWLPPSETRPTAPNRLRALVVERRATPMRVDGTFPIGELVRPSKSHPVALISIERAEWLVASARSGAAANEMPAVAERRLGIVLGRALAHEIGHFLLGTHTHARRGLMRPHFDAAEFTDLRDGLFSLDRDAAAWLRTGSAEKFAYASR
jgi:hypothetical protein